MTGGEAVAIQSEVWETGGNMRKGEHLVVLTGAGISAESGLGTFRDQGGIWEHHRLEEVATPEAFVADPARVLAFYNERRRQVLAARPNAAHRALAELERRFRVTVITQNVDDLHERAGSSRVLHLHGEILKARSSADPSLVYPRTGDILPGETCERGSPLRPAVVWFGEEVPMMDRAMAEAATADHLLVVGTSLQVYPAASLVQAVLPGTPLTLIDPDANLHLTGAELIRDSASRGVADWAKRQLAAR